MSARQKNRSRVLSAAALKLKREGKTNREIAETLNIDIAQVPKRIKLGERFSEPSQGVAA